MTQHQLETRLEPLHDSGLMRLFLLDMYLRLR